MGQYVSYHILEIIECVLTYLSFSWPEMLTTSIQQVSSIKTEIHISKVKSCKSVSGIEDKTIR